MSRAHARLPIALLFASTLASALASAAPFDERTGQVTLKGAVNYGFDSRATVPEGMALSATDHDEQAVPDDRLAAAFRTLPTIEGSGALSVGGEVASFALEFSAASPLMGRRVEVTLWIQPRGTTANAQLNWIVGKILAGDAQLRPTGRATDDGWIELSSGPVDFALGEAIAPTLTLGDASYQSMYLSNVLDPVARVLVDALEVVDLGPAAVPPVACNLSTEAAACGALGACLYGRCVDSAASIGSLPQGAVRDTYWTGSCSSSRRSVGIARWTRGSPPTRRSWPRCARRRRPSASGRPSTTPPRSCATPTPFTRTLPSPAPPISACACIWETQTSCHRAGRDSRARR